MGFDFNGARIAITGGATGIGLAIGRRMAADGAKIAICGPDQAALDDAVSQLKSAGAPDAFGCLVDVTEPKAFTDWTRQVADRFGGIDVGWNNAGVMGVPSPVADMDWADYEALMAVNLTAVFRGSQLFLRQMLTQYSPSLLINTGSENSLFYAVPNSAPYVASKMAVGALTEGLRLEVPPRISVKLLCPGFVNTPLGDPAQFQHGMDVERFADIAYAGLKSDRFYVVSHGFNDKRVADRAERIRADIAAIAAPAEETRRYDTFTLLGLDDLGRPK